MAAPLAELVQANHETFPDLSLVTDTSGPVKLAEIRLISEVEHDGLTRARFERWLGSIIVGQTAEVVPAAEVEGTTSLLKSVRLAKAGSAEAMRMVDKNVDTAVYEACFKDDHISEGVETWVNKNGERIQHGQSTISVQHNALVRPNRHKVLIGITQAEGLNDFRIGDAQRAGLLKDNYLLIGSIVPADVPKEELGPDGDGYFLEDLTLVFQATTELAEGHISTTAAFTAGVEAEEGDEFEDKMAKRYDIAALTMLYEIFGFKAPTTAQGFIENGLLIPKELMPNGVVDFLRWFQEATDKVLGRQVERKPEDYIALIAESKKREASMADTCAKVKADLLAAVDRMSQPMDPIKLLWKLVKKHALADSVENLHINPKVFGPEAEPYILQVRRNTQTGNAASNYWLMQRAYETAVISTCGGGSGKQKDKKASGFEWDNSPSFESEKIDTTKSAAETYCPEIKNGQKVECPDCHETVEAIVPTGEDKVYCSNPDCDLAHPDIKRKLEADE